MRFHTRAGIKSGSSSLKWRVEMKTFKSYMIITAALTVLTMGLAHCSSGGNSGSSSSDKNGDGTANTLSGVAAAGAPVASATITLKDRKGSLKTSVTGTDGKYSFDITDMTAPFLLKVPSGTGRSLQRGNLIRNSQYPPLYGSHRKELVRGQGERCGDGFRRARGHFPRHRPRLIYRRLRPL